MTVIVKLVIRSVIRKVTIVIQSTMTLNTIYSVVYGKDWFQCREGVHLVSVFNF